MRNLLDMFRSRDRLLASKPTTLIVVPDRAIARRGMWIVYNGSVGILAEWYNDGTGDFHLVADDGTTREVMKISLEGLRQARYDEIPMSRRPDPDTAVKFGYQL